jgi:hypothetical protein
MAANASKNRSADITGADGCGSWQRPGAAYEL